MRQLSTIILVIFIFFSYCLPSYSAYKGEITYSIPIEYKNLSESELKDKAEKYFYLALKTPEGELSEDVTNALVAYSVLQHLNTENIEYFVRVGILYDRINKDRQAKGNFSRAIGINPSAAEPYFYFGEFYYKRGQYRQALKYYNRAFENLKSPNHDLYYKLGDVYEKLGDTKKALECLNMAKAQSPNDKLDAKIRLIEAIDESNKTYYRGKF